MKSIALSFAIVLAGIANIAVAGKPVQVAQSTTLPAISASHGSRACTQPGEVSIRACAGFYQLLSAHFTPRELKDVVAWEATHPQYLFDKIYALHDRYEVVLQEYVAMQRATRDTEVAAR